MSGGDATVLAASSFRKNWQSVTSPNAWCVPRSISLVMVSMLLSTQMICTEAGSRFPVATECSVVATMMARPTPGIRRPHRVLRADHVGDDIGQRAVVADAAREHVVGRRA